MQTRSMRLATSLLVALFALPPSAGYAQSSAASGDADFEALAHAYYYDVSFPRDPVGATGFGVHTYDAHLGSYAPRAIAKRLADDDTYLAKIAAIDATTLSPEVAIDAKLLANTLHDDKVINGELEMWKHNPDYYVRLASGGVYADLERAYAPLAVRAEFAIARELAIPALFARAETNLTTVDATTAKLAYDDAAGSEHVFTTTVPEALSGLHDAPLHASLMHADAVAKRAMTSYAHWIARHPLAHPSGTFAIGPKIFTERLKYEEGLDISIPRYREIGEAALAGTRARFIATAKEIDPTKSPQAVESSLELVHPTAAALLPTAQHDLVTLPADADITVIPTPVFERATTFASMDASGPLETVATYGYYTLGKLEMLKLRKDMQKKLGAQYTLEKFHDMLLAHGDPPLPLLRPLLLGDADDGNVL